jgi:hypothetical protein
MGVGKKARLWRFEKIHAAGKRGLLNFLPEGRMSLQVFPEGAALRLDPRLLYNEKCCGSSCTTANRLPHVCG